MTHKRIYISGPMTGVPEHNFPAFNAAADKLRQAGWEVINPAENFGGKTNLPREVYLRKDVMQLAQCMAIAMLPGWQESRGASMEYFVARELGMEIIDAETLQPMTDAPQSDVTFWWQLSPESILDTASRITAGCRQQDYGHPNDDFSRTAQMWTGVLAHKLRDGAAVTAMDIPLCMIAVKLARQAHHHKRDNLVDIAGYARTAAMVAGDE